MAESKIGDSAFERQIGGDHYKRMAIQPAQFIMANDIPWAEGSIVQYVVRWRDKGGIDDLNKAKHLIDMIIEQQREFEVKRQASHQNTLWIKT